MVADILIVTGELMELFKKHELSRIQSMFVLKATELQITEELTREIIADTKKGYDTQAGVM